MSGFTEGQNLSLFPGYRTDLANSEPHILWAHLALPSDGKQMRYETDHSLTSRAAVNNAWSSISTPPSMHGA